MERVVAAQEELPGANLAQAARSADRAGDHLVGEAAGRHRRIQFKGAGAGERPDSVGDLEDRGGSRGDTDISRIRKFSVEHQLAFIDTHGARESRVGGVES